MLGSTWMVNHDLIFDNKAKTIGFVEADCNNTETDFEYFLTDDNCDRLNDQIFILESIIVILICIIFFLIYRFYIKKKRNDVIFNKLSTDESKY